MLTLIFYSLIGGLFSLAGGFLLLWKEVWAKKIITPLLSFAAGAFLAAAFFDVVPEAIEMSEEVRPILAAVVLGFTIFFALERLLMAHFLNHSHGNNTHSDHAESLPTLVILGDGLHNFLDGVVLALAFVANPALGLVTAFAIASHELPQEIGDFSILLSQGWSKLKIIQINIFQSFLTVLGAVIGYYSGQFLENYLAYLLGGVGGVFMYLGASNLIPELHHKAGHKSFLVIILPFVISLLIVYTLVSLTHSEL